MARKVESSALTWRMGRSERVSRYVFSTEGGRKAKSLVDREDMIL